MSRQNSTRSVVDKNNTAVVKNDFPIPAYTFTNSLWNISKEPDFSTFDWHSFWGKGKGLAFSKS
jgi:hypothetical protein